MSKQSAIISWTSAKETQEEVLKQAQSQRYRHQSNITDIILLRPIANLVPISHLAAVSTLRLQADKCRQSRYFLAFEIKQNLHILTVKRMSHSQIKLTYPKFDTKSLHGLQSHPSGFHLLILFLKSSRLFRFLISIETICQTFEAKDLIELRPYLLLFREKNQIEFISCILST